jgi:AcrR family transcriptional regulator
LVRIKTTDKVVIMSTEPGLRERKKEQTRQAILGAALRLFSAHGFDSVSVAEIAAEANVSAATVFNYFPTKQDLVFVGMEVFEARLVAAVRERDPGESVLAAFGRFVLQIRGLLASADAEAASRLAAISRMITESPTLIAREREVTEQYTQSLAKQIADETGAGADDVTPWVAANALMGVHRALVDHVHRRMLAGAPSTRVAHEVRELGRHALTLIERGLGDYAVKAR